MLAVSLSSPTLAGALAAALALAPGPARAEQVPSDDALACLLPVFDGQTAPADARSDKIDPKSAEAAAKAKAKWWRSPELRAEFGITDAQSTELDHIFHSFYASLKSGMADVDRYHKDVSKMMAEGSSSEVDVLHAIDKLEAAKASLSRTRMLMLYRMYQVLSPDQRIKVKRYQEQKDAAASAPR
jgi:Spy/CpxP family protein refolding chaperone